MIPKVLEDDTDLAMMNLTRMYQSPEDYLPPLSAEVLEDHEEMELLLEAFLQVRVRRGRGTGACPLTASLVVIPKRNYVGIVRCVRWL